MREFSQLSYHERKQIYTGLCLGKSKRMIAEELERSVSTITRETARNSDQYGYLYAGEAHEMAQQRKHINDPKIDRNPKLKAYIIEKLKEKWSPDTIANRWCLDHNDQSLCRETIYQWLYSDNEDGKVDLRKLLVRARKKRGLKPKKNKSKIKDRVSIHQRPENINNRKEAGHYECDLMFNSGSQSKNICTFIERTTRKVFLIRNDNKSTKAVIKALIKLIKREKLIVKSITFDNGLEFADHIKLKALNIETYFCDPGSPWQKGSVENCNGVARRHIPFNLPAAEITNEYVAKVNERINNMPRRILSGKTPLEAFNEAFQTKGSKMESRMKFAQPAIEANLYNQKGLSVAFRS